MLADETQWIITGSAVRCATKTSPNLRMNPLEGEDQPQDLISGVIVYGWPHPDGSEDPLTGPLSLLMTCWGDCFCFLSTKMGRKRELPSLTMPIHLTKPKFPEKTNSGSNSKFIETSLMTLSIQPTHGVLGEHPGYWAT